MSTYFETCANVGAVKTLYRKLAMQWHPDRGGDLETMKQINLAYEAALAGRHGEVSQGFDGKPHTYSYNAKVEREIMDKIAEVLAALGKLVGTDLTLELVGTWLWMSGDTKPHKDAIKALKFHWNGTRRIWQWHRPGYRTHASPLSSDDLRRAYGTRSYASSEAEQVATI